MSIEDLHDLAAKIHAHEQEVSRNAVRPEEFGLLAKALLQAIDQIAILDERVKVLEDKPRADA